MFSSPLRVAIATLGCKLNQAESENIAALLAKSGYSLTDDGEYDILVLNTCTVTHTADRKARQLLRKAHRQNPRATLVVTGCYAQRQAEDLLRIPGVKLVIGNEDKYRMPQILAESGLRGESHVQHLFTGRNRAFIKIQDGCQRFCAYCIVPLVRSDCISTPTALVIEQVRSLEIQGYKEIVLTGTEIGNYHYAEFDLSGLVRRLLNDTAIPRIRLSSLQPEEITPDILSLWQNDRLCRHIHLPLQSGSDATLTRMRRRYTSTEFEAKTSMIRAAIPDVGITTDIIIGFPGETDREFTESYDFMQRSGFSRIHVFPYSSRPGTMAATLPEKVPDRLKRERLMSMLELSKTSARQFAGGLIGRELPVLFEEKHSDYWTGYTGNYIRVYTKNERNLKNQIVPVNLDSVFSDGMLGKSTV